MSRLCPPLLGGEPHGPDPALDRGLAEPGTTPLTSYWVELALGNPALALAELAGAAAAIGGEPAEPDSVVGDPRLKEIRLPSASSGRALAERLALARRVLRPFPQTVPEEILARLEQEGGSGSRAAFRVLGRGRSSPDLPALHACARRYRAGGGAIDLERPDRRFWIVVSNAGGWRLTEEVGRPEPGALRDRRMPRLPFQRPVSLPPTLGRVAANLARVRPGDRVVDPFVGTGALLLEAALLGARVTGVDRDPTMVRGALVNLARFEARVDRLNVADAAEAFPPPDGEGWDAVLTDPPYGRSSGSAGENPEALVARVLPHWAAFVRPGGRIVVVLPGGADPLPPPWRREIAVTDRVHRSLTREFRVYARPRDPATMR